jgi:hypothetical protein
MDELEFSVNSESLLKIESSDPVQRFSSSHVLVTMASSALLSKKLSRLVHSMYDALYEQYWCANSYLSSNTLLSKPLVQDYESMEGKIKFVESAYIIATWS